MNVTPHPLQIMKPFLTKRRFSLLSLFLLISVEYQVYGTEGKIAFTSNRDGEWAIYIMDGDGGNPFKLTDGGTPAWLPNGEKIGFVHDGDFWVIDREGTDRKNITKGRFKESMGYPAWSPDGEEIAYWSRVGGIFGIPDIYLMDADGRNPKKLTDDLFHDDRPSWSPDGRKIAFSAYLRPQENGRKTEIFSNRCEWQKPRQPDAKPECTERPCQLVARRIEDRLHCFAKAAPVARPAQHPRDECRRNK